MFREILIELCGGDALSRSRRHENVTAKTLMIRQLYREGWRLPEMCEILKLNHSTVIYHHNRGEFINLPGWDAEKELWNKFNTIIDELDSK